MAKATNKQKIELIRDLIGNSDSDETLGTIESELVRRIYRISHPHVGCPHPDWEKETKDLVDKLNKDK